MRYSCQAFAFLLLVSATGSLKAQPTPSAQQPGLQERFNTATEAWVHGDCATALPLFEQIAQDKRIKPGSLPAAAIAVRRGDCMVRTANRSEGENLIAAGLPVLRQAGAEFANDVASVEMTLGDLAVSRWDQAGALAHYRASLALRQGMQRAHLLMRIARLTSFDGGRVALDAIDEGLAITQAQPSPDKKSLSAWHTVRGRVLLNQGDVKEGRKELLKALSLAGGMTDTITVGDASMRQDLAQAAMLAHDQDDAYRYMGMSGAGRIANSPFSSAKFMQSPICGPETGLSPDDMTVVEFSILQNGEVGDAQPVYSTGNYAQAAAFARSVSDWLWSPDDAARLPSFFRAATRVEMHCTRSEGSGGASPATPLLERLTSLIQPRTAVYRKGIASKSGWTEWVPVAEAARSAGDNSAELLARTLLAPVDLRRPAEVMASIDRALAILPAADMPKDAKAAAMVILTSAKSRIAPVLAGKPLSRRTLQVTPDAYLTAVVSDPLVAEDPLAHDVALLMAQPMRPRAEDQAKSTEAIESVAKDNRLPEHHPVRQYAQLRLASDLARLGKLEEAQKWFEATGLSQEQCALIGPRPALAKDNAGGAFPWDALRWGFEGWVSVEFDIKADGGTAAVRPVIAYPPFIFSDAGKRMMLGARYQSSFRPSGGSACSASQESIRFIIPGNENVTREIKRKPGKR